MIVADASAVVELLRNTTAGRSIREVMVDPQETVLAPCLLDAEVAQVLRRLSVNGTMTQAQATAALDVHCLLDIRRVEHRPLLHRAWELRANTTAYDALYLALAEALDAPLLTTDRKLARSPGHHARFLVID